MTEPYWEPLAAAPITPSLSLIFDAQVGRGQPGDPTVPTTLMDSQTILGGSIPQIYRHLMMLTELRTDQAGTNVFTAMRFNADTTNYFGEQMYGSAGSVGAGDTSALGFLNFGVCPAAGAPANTASHTTLWIPSYTGTIFHKGFNSIVGDAAFNAGADEIRAFSGRWASVAPITRMQISPNFSTPNWVVGSRWTLYGLS